MKSNLTTTDPSQLLLAFMLFILPSCGPQHSVPLAEPSIQQEVLADGLQVPYAIAVIGEEDFLVTDRMGGLFRYQGEDLTRISGLPESQTFLADRHYGGMLDISLHPKFKQNQLVYLAYVNTDYAMQVIRFKLENTAAKSIEEVFSSDQFSIGARIEWEDDDHFFLSFGVGGSPKPEPGPQDLSDYKGKIFRLHANGSIPEDNPVFSGHPEAIPGIWSYGHRDPQGLYFDQEADILYANEHGPLGGDELNIILKGGNYGWPIFSYGLNYDGSQVSDMTEEEAAKSTTLPTKYWTTEFRLAPGCLLYVKDSNFTEWNGSFLIGGLAYQQLVRYDLENDVTEIAIDKAGRVHDIAILPSGNLVMLVDEHSPNRGSSGRIVKLTQAE